MEVNDSGLIALLGKRDEKAFEQVFTSHFRQLHAYAMTLVKEEMAAEEMVQHVFYKLWERSEALSISGSIAAYLYRAVHNESLNYLKHMKVRSAHQLHVIHRSGQESDMATNQLHLKELEGRLRIALNELPEQCRTIFQLSRFEELRYREIADRLGISVKTVENQMGKALKLLRTKLIDFLILVLLLIHK
ncbi:MAG TPA: RNA polymerase sigma-70 factor [Flavisolibacter sp.]|jgi:RNA polymerase sigma-70 factor (ECF subfamily)|nr:RNA polymerase sigma-70 factor [Flavisolibacter sp.]